MEQYPQADQNRGWQNAIAKVQQLDEFYRSSPTAQMLIANAPMILQQCKEIRSATMQQQAALETLSINRQYDLE